MGAQRQIGRIADPGNIDDIHSTCVMLLQGTSKSAAQMFVENKAQRHSLKDLVRKDGLNAPPDRIHIDPFRTCSTLEFFDVKMLAGGTLFVNFCLASSNVGIHLRSICRVELQHLVDQLHR